MEESVKKSIDTLAEKTRKIIDPNFNNISIEEYLERKGIDITYFDGEIDGKHYDAILKWDSDKKKPIIYVNAFDAETRQRFSIAHELGHLILDWNWIPGFDNSDVIDNLNKNKYLSVQYRGKEDYSNEERVREQYANEFAAAFLMPNSCIEELKNIYNVPEQIVEQLSLRCGVSRDAARFRLLSYK